MNYLAHIFLSGNKMRLSLGNFIGDFVKGNQHKNYPQQMQQGILLHRAIDHYTDNHPIVLECVDFMRPSFGRYSGIVLDMYFDYFLAKNFKKYSPLPFRLFCYRFYATALLHYFYIPKRVRGFIFHFVTTNRLGKYATKQGLHGSLQIMHRYKSKAIEPDNIIAFLNNNEKYLEKQFELFFEDLKDLAPSP